MICGSFLNTQSYNYVLCIKQIFIAYYATSAFLCTGDFFNEYDRQHPLSHGTCILERGRE